MSGQSINISYLGDILVEAVNSCVDLLASLLKGSIDVLLCAGTVLLELGISVGNAPLCVVCQVVDLLACICSVDLSTALELVCLAWELSSDRAGGLCDVVYNLSAMLQLERR